DFVKAVADRDDGILVAHPDRLSIRKTGEHGRLARDLEPCRTVLAPAVLDAATVLLRDFLMTETEAENRHVEIENALVEADLVARRERRAARQDHAPYALERPDRIVRLPDLGQHVLPPHLGGDEMRVLAAEVHNRDPVVGKCRHRFVLPTVRAAAS